MGRERIVLNTAEETLALGSRFAHQLRPNDILALQGDLGAGKTTFMQGLLQGLKISDRAQSPTFTLLQTYSGPLSIHHFDLYRIDDEREFTRLGFEEFFYSGDCVAIEWPERIESLIPDEAYLIQFFYAEQGRIAEIKRWKER